MSDDGGIESDRAAFLMLNYPADVQIGPLLRIVFALDELAAIAATLPSPMPPEDGVPLVDRVRVLAALALAHLDEQSAEQLQRVLHPTFFDTSARQEYPSFVTRSSLAVMRGFLRGRIAETEREAQIEANARAYAEAKVREERGIGFMARS